MKGRRLADKVQEPSKLGRLLSKRKSKGGKNRVVFTNGCFDLLHRGHVSYLESARALGGILVVALDTDAAVRKLKGPRRPINPLADRAAVVAALESVDYVTWFGGCSPLSLIRKLRPDVLVKGGDWSPEDIIGAKDVWSWGGAVKSLPYLKGRSSTAIIRRASKRR